MILRCECARFYFARFVARVKVGCHKEFDLSVEKLSRSRGLMSSLRSGLPNVDACGSQPRSQTGKSKAPPSCTEREEDGVPSELEQSESLGRPQPRRFTGTSKPARDHFVEFSAVTLVVNSADAFLLFFDEASVQ